MTFPSTETERLTIRELGAADRPALDGFVRDPGQLRLMLFSMANPEEADSFLSMAMESARASPRLEYHLAVEGPALREPHRRILAGCVSLMREDPEHPEAELGYFFLREHWGRGYALESCRPLVDFAFKSLGLHRVWGMCHSENAASAKVMEKLGMRREGMLREHRVLRGAYRSSLIFGMLEHEWEADPDQRGSIEAR